MAKLYRRWGDKFLAYLDIYSAFLVTLGFLLGLAYAAWRGV